MSARNTLGAADSAVIMSNRRMTSDTTNDVMTTTNETARSGKTETITEVLTRIQLRRVPDRYWLVCEEWDWLAIMQCLQDNGWFKTNPRRPPFAAFERWLQDMNIPVIGAPYSAYEMSLAYRRIEGAHYPWTEVTVDPGMIRRWRILYKDLAQLLSCLTKPVS